MSLSQLDRPAGSACPHDGWYNGNPKLMLINGTYEDFRYFFAEYVEQNKMTQSELDELDRQWEAIPLETRIDARQRVLKDTEPQMKKIDGKPEMVQKPSDNGSATKGTKPQFRKEMTPSRVPGSLASRPDPLAAKLAAKQSAGGVPSQAAKTPVPSAAGSTIPQAVIPPSQSPVPPTGGGEHTEKLRVPSAAVQAA